MSCHMLRNVEFQTLCNPLRQDSKVRTGLPTDLHRFLQGVVYLVHTGISWRDLLPRFGHGNRVFRRYRQADVWDKISLEYVTCVSVKTYVDM